MCLNINQFYDIQIVECRMMFSGVNFGLSNWVLWDQSTLNSCVHTLLAPIAEFFLVKGWETFLRNVALKIRGIRNDVTQCFDF